MSACWGEVPWPMTTERLSIRPGTIADVTETWQYRRLPEVARWISAQPKELAEHAAVFGSPQHLAATLVVELSPIEPAPEADAGMTRSRSRGSAVSGSRIVGDLKFSVGDAWSQVESAALAHGVQAEIGWAFDPVVHGRGYATEAVNALLAIAFDHVGLRRVYAECFAANEPSWRLMERVGMRRETYSVADGLHRSGEWMDGMVYAMLADEWRLRHPGLRNQLRRDGQQRNGQRRDGQQLDQGRPR